MYRTYMTICEVTDYGPYIRKIIISLPQSVLGIAVTKDMFSVHVVRRQRDTGATVKVGTGLNGEYQVESRGYCQVSDAYVSDGDGRKKEKGDYITIIPVFDFLVSELAMADKHNIRVFCDITVTQIKIIQAEGCVLDGLVFDRLNKTSLPCVEGWINTVAHSSHMPLDYGYYAPQTGSGCHPLILWLHGAGEGGFDVEVAYTGNKVVSLSDEKTQFLFGGAYILAPQVPTMWLDEGRGEYGHSGKSMYVEALKSLIDKFINIHGDVDQNRIYIGGCSNGGFMTMRMIIDYPGFFAAAFPVCEALYDDTISEEDINAIKDTPLWFTHARNDIIVKPEETVLPTYKRLLKAGAENVHFTFLESVADEMGLFSDEKGHPYDFLGHFSWVPLFNGLCNHDYDGFPVMSGEEKITLLEWLSSQNLGGKDEK